MRKIHKQAWTVLLTVLLIPFISFSQSVNLNIPDDLCHTDSAQVGSAYNLKLTFFENGCVNLFGQNPGVIARQLTGGDNVFTIGAPVSELCLVKLSSISQNNSFNFGPACGEANADDANVTINFTNATASDNQPTQSSTMFQLDIPQADILTISDDSSTPGNYTQDYLKVVATSSNTATINISGNANQGQVLICIIQADGDKRTLAVLDPDPKSSTLMNFTVEESVYVVPVIRPKVQTTRGVSERIYEVGDPRRNARIEVDEEDEE